MNFKEPRKVEKNSVVLLRNIANESKREPMKFARVLQINDSKDDAQRILTLEYNNIKKNKDGNWIGMPKIVERSINDVIPIDKAVNESMLNPNILGKVVTDGISEEDEETREIIERDELNQNDSNENVLNKDSEDRTNDNDETINHKQVRRSERIKKRLVNINPEDIGDNDNENDEDYKS